MITGVDVQKIEAKLREPNGEMIGNMKFNINFESVKVSQENVTVGFIFTAVYEGSKSNKLGELTLQGNIIAKEVKKDADEIDATWKNKKTLPVRFAEDVINLLNFECGARGTLVAYSMGFPAPLPISKARLQENTANAKAQ